MGADGRQSHHICVGVDDGPTAGQVVSCAASWRGDQHAISLHYGQKSVVDVHIEATHELSVATRDADLVERVAHCWLH